MVFLPLLLGLVAAVIGVAPPGLLNMTVAKVSAVEGKGNAIFFSLGACIIVFFQTYLAVLGANFLYQNPKIVIVLQEIGSLVFLGLTVYFFSTGRRKKKQQAVVEIQNVTQRFFSGMFLSALNMLPIPYYVFLSMWFSSKGWFSFTTQQENAFVFGAVLGSFLIFYLYLLFFKKRENELPSFFATNGNYIIGSVTGLVSLITLFKLLKQYWN
jgi:threonine/homoserine/homoserine lactone efflux protein